MFICFVFFFFLVLTFIKSSIVYAVTLRTFVRIQTMIWTRGKTFWRIFGYPIGLYFSLNYISCLDCLSRSLSYRFGVCCFNFGAVVHEHRMPQKYSKCGVPCIIWIWCFRNKMQTNIILWPLPTSFSKPIITPTYYITAEWPDRTVPSYGEFYIQNVLSLCCCHLLNCCGREARASIVLNEWLQFVL